MNKIFNSVLAIALMAAASFTFVACADEDEGSKVSNLQSNLSKTIGSDAYSFEHRYPGYEDIEFTTNEVNSKLEYFNVVMNSTSLPLENMELREALFIMEAYLNYGVIDKVNAQGTEANDSLKTFRMTLALDNGTLLGSELKEAYFEFVVDFLTAMRGKIMPLADMYVEEISSSSVTFAVDVRELKASSLNFKFPQFYSLSQCGNINIPSNVTSDWTYWLSMGRNFEENVYKYSKKPLSEHHVIFYTGYIFFFNLSHAQSQEPPFGVWAYQSEIMLPPYYNLVFNNVQIKEILIPAMLNKLDQIRAYLINVQQLSSSKIMVDYTPTINYKFITLPLEGKSYYMYPSRVDFATPHNANVELMFHRAIDLIGG
jgi:hypothetical protein